MDTHMRPSPEGSEKSLLFFRDYQFYTGGQQKVADYFSHLNSAPDFTPFIAFSPESISRTATPWQSLAVEQLVSYCPHQYDYLFVAGMDWQQLKGVARSPNQPVINLIQHVRHANPQESLFEFLQEPAIRISVSHEVQQALEATGRVSGPIVTIANGHGLLPVTAPEKIWDLLILGPKNPAVAHQLQAELEGGGLNICCVDSFIPRQDLANKMAASRIAILLPHATEGFYLPALEAMAYCDICIVPDCVGNRSFCHDRVNCLIPEYNAPAMLNSLTEAIALLEDSAALLEMKSAVSKTLEYHSLARERHEFLNLMKDIPSLWRQL